MIRKLVHEHEVVCFLQILASFVIPLEAEKSAEVLFKLFINRNVAIEVSQKRNESV